MMEMGVVRAQIQTVEEIYTLVWTAVANKQPIEARYQGRHRLFCPHRLGRNREGQLRVLCYQYGGESQTGLHPMDSPANWRCVALEKLSSVKLVEGSWRTAPNHARPPRASWKSILTPRITLSAIRKKGSEAVAAATGAPEQCVASRSSADYVARGVRDDPRGWKSGAGSRAANPR